MQVLAAQAEVDVPAKAAIAPIRVPRRGLVGLAEELDLHLLELAAAEREVARVDLVAKRLADLSDPERHAHSRGIADVLEVYEDSLRRLRPQIGHARVVLERADMGLEHQIERPRRGQRARRGRTRCPGFRSERFVVKRVRYDPQGGRLPTVRLLQAGDAFAMRLDQRFLLALAGLAGRREKHVSRVGACVAPGGEVQGKHNQLIGAVAMARLAVIDHRVAETADVAAGLPHPRIHQQRAIEAHHPVPGRRTRRHRCLVVPLEHVGPPRLFDVALELDAEGAVVPTTVEPAIDFARRKNEAPAFAQRNDFIHRIHDFQISRRRVERASIAAAAPSPAER